MKNKILINVYVPTLDIIYEVYIPINESINVVLQLIIRTIADLSDSNFNISDPHFLFDADTLTVYSKNQLVRDTNLINSKKLILT